MAIIPPYVASPRQQMGKSQLIIKEDGVLAGVEMAKRIFHDFDPELKMDGHFIQDGAEVKKWGYSVRGGR